MSLVSSNLQRLSKKFEKLRFDRVAMQVLQTPPLVMKDCELLFVSLMCHRDIAMYLLALKSLYLQIGEGRVLIIDDGTITAEDRSLLRRHIPLIDFTSVRDIDTGPGPTYGCWKRLVKVIDLTKSHYVIQLDSDTLTSGPVQEVCDSWKANRSFLLGTLASQEVAPASTVARMVQGWISRSGTENPGIGMRAEAALDSIPGADHLRYAHASAGFSGFAKGAFDHSRLEQFSGWMRERVGAAWGLWGSEQIASNYMLSNAPNPQVLPLAKYACFEPQVAIDVHPFVHFIGSYRYDRGVYRQRAGEFIRQCGTVTEGQSLKTS